MHTEAIDKLHEIKGVQLPEGKHFRDILVTGPPGSGKTTMVERLGGWPEEGYLDLTQKNWWRSRLLTFRPREVHFGIPFWDHPQPLTVFDPAWIERFAPIEPQRIEWPPDGGLLSADWRGRYLYDFQLPPPEAIHAARVERNQQGTHPVDESLSLALVSRQWEVYSELAGLFHENGMNVVVRLAFGGPPRQIASCSGRTG